MSPYADFTYFGLLLYIVIPTIVLGVLLIRGGGPGVRTWHKRCAVPALVLHRHDEDGVRRGSRRTASPLAPAP